MFQKIIIILLILLAAFLVVTERPQKTDPEIVSLINFMGGEIEALKKETARIRALETELAGVKKLVAAKRSQEAPIRPVKVSLNGSHINDPYLGAKDAPVVIMGFSNYQCLPCRQFTRSALQSLRKDYIDTGKVKFVFRDLPLRSNPQAFAAATLAHCAGEQGKYWEMHDALFANVELVDQGELLKLAEHIEGIDAEKLNSCFLSRKYDSEISRDFDEAREFGAKGAPCFLIAKNKKDSDLRGIFLRGAQPYPVFKRQIEQILANSTGDANS